MRPARTLLAFLLAALALPAFAAPDEELLGKAKGYPIGTRANWFYDEGVRVGSFSHLDEILPHYALVTVARPSFTASASSPAAECICGCAARLLSSFVSPRLP